MASGQQKAQQNLEAFEVWKATQTDDDFKQIVFRGQLNRIEVAKGLGCGKSALNQNPALKKALKALEGELRDRGVLPPITEAVQKRVSADGQEKSGYTDLMVDGAPLPHQPDTTLRWLIDRLRS